MKDVTVLVFMAADNDLGLDSFALRDLHEMERIGSSEQMSLVVQLDRYGGGDDGTTLRGEVVKDPDWTKRPVRSISKMTDIGETDTGNPAVLRDFIIWGASNFPSRRYILILWAHGTGWRGDVIESAVGKVAGPEVELAAKSVDFGEMYRERTVGLLFRRTVEASVENFVRQRLLPALDVSGPAGPTVSPMWMTTVPSTKPDDVESNTINDLFSRAVASDSTDLSALDALELKTALFDARSSLKGGLVPDFEYWAIGFDACLMGCVEALFQLRELTDMVVSSQEEEPRTGWRYDLVLQSILDFNNDTELLGRSLVDNYIEAQASYLIRLITLSAVQTASLQKVTDALNQVGRILLEKLNVLTRLIQRAEKTATRFRGDRDFIDCIHFIKILEEQVEDKSVAAELRTARLEIEKAIIVSRFSFARKEQHPTGLSVYFPAIARYDAVYDTLDAAPELEMWTQFIKAYHFL